MLKSSTGIPQYIIDYFNLPYNKRSVNIKFKMNKPMAISVKTESGDSYLFCSRVILDESQLETFLKYEMGSEYDYISSIETAICDD